MKYKPGDKVRIKSLEWYNENKTEYGWINGDSSDAVFVNSMSKFCGNNVTITKAKNDLYSIADDGEYYSWADYMIECLVERNNVDKPKMVSLDKVKEWLNKNLTTEYLYAHENDDYPISYVRVIGKNQTVYDVVEQFCKAMKE